MSLNFGGINIGGTNEGGSGTSNHAQLTNLAFENSGHTGFLNSDASNLTTTGQKVFDGQWVSSKLRLISGYITYPTSENQEHSLSTYLPQDEYIYEVMVSGVTRAAAYNDYARIELATDIFTNIIFAGCRNLDPSASPKIATASGTVILPVGSERKLIVHALDNVTATYSMWAMGYRRIGTNQ